MKKRGFGAGWYNGYGGKPEPGETIIQTAIREFNQESGSLTWPDALEKIAEIKFTFIDNPDWDQCVHVYKVLCHEGEPEETEEMTSEKFKFSEIPWDRMWPADRHWIPMVLKG